MTEAGRPAASGADTAQVESVADVAGLYLGNILYALEVTALSLDDQQKPADAAFYRGIARKLAEARGREASSGKTQN